MDDRIPTSIPKSYTMASPEYQKIPLDQFQQEFKDTSTEVSSVALGGRIVSFSDEFFAEATNLLKVEVSFFFFIVTSQSSTH